MVTPIPATRQTTLMDAPLSTERLSRPQLIDRIVQVNGTATPEFLSAFSDTALEDYLAHLSIIDDPCIPWVRRGLSPAIVRREAAE